MIKNVSARNRSTLNEYEAKQILKAFGIPVVTEKKVETIDDAIRAADQIGFPVAVKGLGAELAHKTESGLVVLNLTDAGAVRRAAETIRSRAGQHLEGFLVQAHIAGHREFVAGMFRDKQFGPVILFGSGGIFTEAYADITLRLAPISDATAADMLEEIQAAPLLKGIRGMNAADRTQLIRTLTGLSKLAMDFPDISEVDINPIIITPNGQSVAVDALIVPGTEPQRQKYSAPVSPKVLLDFFHPRSIAFIGASSVLGKWGHLLFTLVKSRGYKGDCYLVNPRGGRIAGMTVHKSIREIPEPLDLAVVTIPASGVEDLIPDLQQKGIHRMVLISSGFTETGDNGKRLEQQIVEKAKNAGILILGPNTMGISNPHIQFYCTGSHVWPEAGSTTVISQSGNMGMQLLHFAEQQDIGIRAFSGIGNEAMITVEDHLDAFGEDDLTRSIMLYIENIKNGRRFFESARRVSRKKPVVLLKGGQSRIGRRAARSHTGAMAGDTRVFDTACRQAGIIKVDYSMDLVDLSAAFSSLPLPAGNRVGVMSFGGGWGVITADLCSACGLKVPDLPPDLIERIDRILPPYWNRMNPIDLVGEVEASIPLTLIEELLKWNQCDGVIHLGILGRSQFTARRAASALMVDPDITREFVESYNRESRKSEKQFVTRSARLMEQYQKPVIGVSLPTIDTRKTVYAVKNCSCKGVFFPTPERAVKAFARMYEYRKGLSA